MIVPPAALGSFGERNCSAVWILVGGPSGCRRRRAGSRAMKASTRPLRDAAELRSVLVLVLDRLDRPPAGSEYRLVGTAAALLHGVTLPARDIDLLSLTAPASAVSPGRCRRFAVCSDHRGFQRRDSTSLNTRSRGSGSARAPWSGAPTSMPTSVSAPGRGATTPSSPAATMSSHGRPGTAIVVRAGPSPLRPDPPAVRAPPSPRL